jgi:asparagine synthase (glutamine-hydrolysing)
MCGIAGFVGTRDLEPPVIDRALASLARRGPDDSGVVRFAPTEHRRVVLINRRLRIIDLDPRAAQPLQHSGSTMTFNGELYNYLELRGELEGEGVVFHTASDTEVMAAVLAHRGVAGLERCEGMWALACYEASTGALTLCRDRFGEKPLCLLRDPEGLYFASEPKSLAAIAGRRLTPNLNHLHRYLVNGYKSLYKTRETFFTGVTDLPAGSWLRIDANGEECSGTYWTPTVAPDSAMSFADAVGGVRRHLERSVALRLRADVPLAFCLSGGVDSNALAAIAARVLGYDVHGFTIADADPRYAEGALARLSAEFLGIRHSEVGVTHAGFLDDLRTLVRYHDAPVATSSYFVQWRLLGEVARQGYRVSVSGTAADEIFSGYYDHHLFYLLAMRGDAQQFDVSRRAWDTHVRPFVRNPLLRDPARFLDDEGSRDHVYFEAEQFAAMLRRPWREPFTEVAHAGADVLRNRMLNELRHESVPVILHEDDLNAMFYSIENRSPYLDRGLVDFCGTIPTRHLVHDGYAKAVLRGAVRDLLPAEIVDNRRKIGFNASILSLLDVASPAVRNDILADSPIFDVVRRESIVPLLDATELPNSVSKFMFQFLNAKIFLEQQGATA